MTQIGNWVWDDTNKKWVKLAGTSAGAMSIHAIVEELDDIEDVNVPTPTDLYILYWDNGNSRWACRAISDWAVVMKALFDANTMLYATSDNTPVALTIAASRIVGRKSSGNIVALTGAELMAILTGQAGAAFSFNSQAITNVGALTTEGVTSLCGTKAVLNSWGAVFGDAYYLYMRTDYSAYIASINSGFLDLSGNSGVRFRVSGLGMIAAFNSAGLLTLSYGLQTSAIRWPSAGIGTLNLPSRTDPVTQPAEGTLWYNITKKLIEFATASGMETVVTRGATQTLTNKTWVHKTTHQNGGSDKISVAGLSGLLADDQHVLDAEVLSAVKGDANLPVATIGFVIGDGVNVITTGIKGDLEIPFACTINRVTMVGYPSGSIVVDIWKQDYDNAPPEDGDSITASAPPTITTAEKSQDSTLSGWTAAIAAGDCLRFNVDSITDIKVVVISLKVTKT